MRGSRVSSGFSQVGGPNSFRRRFSRDAEFLLFVYVLCKRTVTVTLMVAYERQGSAKGAFHCREPSGLCEEEILFADTLGDSRLFE